MDDILLDDVLYHAGVKGMKWGVRKQRPTGGGVRARVGSALAKQHERGQNKKFQANLKRLNRAEKSIASSRGSSKRALAKSIGKTAVLSGLTTLGTATVSYTAKNPRTKQGALLIGNIIGASVVGRGVMDANDIYDLGKYKGV